MTNTQAAISAATANKPKGYKTRFCGTFFNGNEAPGETGALWSLDYARRRLVSLVEQYPDITVTFFGNLAQIDHRHARILACLIHTQWTFMERNAVGGNYNYVIPNNEEHYILTTLGKLLDEPINNHKEFV